MKRLKKMVLGFIVATMLFAGGLWVTNIVEAASAPVPQPRAVFVSLPLYRPRVGGAPFSNTIGGANRGTIPTGTDLARIGTSGSYRQVRRVRAGDNVWVRHYHIVAMGWNIEIIW
ncbi:MAG: hypothetical protein FWE07_03690 [Turicibacter sp.]|nr:hypothetical protein [Turicibacter sp.]